MFARLYILLLVLIVMPIIGVSQSDSRTMNVSAYGVQLGFASQRAKISATDVASNVLFVINNTDKTMDLNLELSSPAGWKLFSKKDRKISIKAKDTLYFPVRIRPSYRIEGNTNYILNAFISTDEYRLSNAMWYIEVKKLSAWQAYVPQKKFYLTQEKDSASFSVVITNEGNSDEALQLRILPQADLMLINALGEPIINTPKSVFLRAGQDTTLTYLVKLLDKKKSSTAASNKNKQNKSYSIKLKVLNEKTSSGSTRAWSGNLDFYKVESSVKIKESRYNSLPITVEFNAYDALSDHTFSTLNIYGSKSFKDNSSLNYFFQADFVQNQLNPESYLGNYQYIGYTHKYFAVEIGDIGANKSGSTLSGKGVKGSVNLFKNTLGALYIRKPKLFEDYYASGYGFFHKLSLRKLYWDNYYQHLDNNLSRINGDFGTTYLNFRFLRTHSIQIGGGYSVESHNWNPTSPVVVKGYGYRFGYNGTFNKLGIRLSGIYGSPNYTVRKGTTNANGSINYRFSTKLSSDISYRYSDFKPIIYSQAQIIRDDIYNTQQLAQLKLVYTEGQNMFILNPQYHTILSNPLDVNTAGMGLDYRYKSKTAFKFYSSAFMGYSQFVRNPELGDVFVAFVRASIRYKNLQTSVRYYYGPYYQIEQLQYVNTKYNPQKFYANAFYDYWFLDGQMRVNLNFNYNINTINTRQQLNFRPELFYYAKSGFRFSMYARYMLLGEGEYVREYPSVGGGTVEKIVPASMNTRFEIGAGVKFNINAPIGFKKNVDVKVIAFRDLNGNGKKDKNERGISDMLIHMRLNDTITNDFQNTDQYSYGKIDEYDLVTNSKGFVEYLNMPKGDYVMTATPLASMGGWFDGKTFYHSIDKKKTIYLPLSRGARVSGGILLETDKFGTNKKQPLGNIRVSAVKQDNGKVFSTLTSSDGHFVLFVPNGDYVIMINEAAVSSHFSFMQNNIPLNINEEFENYNISFYLAEKKRNINIRGKRTRQLPIRRTQNRGGRVKQPDVNQPKDSLIDQKTQLEDPIYLPVVEATEEGEVWLVKLYPNEGVRKLKTDFDTLNGVSNIRCITGENGGFLYISNSFAKKKEAKKLLKSIKKMGYKEATVVQMVFGNGVKEEPKDTGIKKTFINVDSEEDRAYYRVEIKTSAKKLNSEDFMSLIPDVTEVYVIEQDGLFKYAVGQFDTFDEAKAFKADLLSKYSIPDAFVTQYKKAW